VNYEMDSKQKPLAALGVTGCIGAYKAAEILRRLQDHGVEIQPILTDSAQKFISALTLQTLAGRKAITGLWDEPDSYEVEHIALSDAVDLLLVAPATANVLAKFACGIADDFLSTFYISTEAPIVIAPAMNTKMWKHPATQQNVEVLRKRGISFVDPGEGYLACGWEGEGRLADVEQIVDAALYALRGPSPLQGRKVLISAGPTVEPVDTIRVLTNRSSGRMGFALAREAKARGADVVLVSGPSAERAPYGVKLRRVGTAAEMRAAIKNDLEETDIVIKAAAVADYQPAYRADRKIKKTGKAMSLDLEPTVDILAWLGSLERKPFLVGFAAESENLRENALQKLKNKNIDMIVANPIGGKEDVLGGNETEGMIITADGLERKVSRCGKDEMAGIIFDVLEKRFKE
jgi:phosphopantothenoylcysteine decarboxylase/phosphopantothenate--cysteine ligase